MRYKFVVLFLLLLSQSLVANDGAYYASGNQLIPIEETEIRITKEILTVRKDGEYIYVTVDYTFFNPASAKTILVGFEAPAPSGDVDGRPVNGQHPYINGFSVRMNNELLSHKVALVDEETYFVNGKINSKTASQVLTDDFNPNEPGFYYVYYFDATFHKGVNRIFHTYKFMTSGSIMEAYSFDYILTAATRWANKQIDDFTLNIDMGKGEGFYVRNTFFGSTDDWTVDDGRKIDNAPLMDNDQPNTKFITFSGGVSYSKMNFVPQGELYLMSPRDLNYEVFNYEEQNLPNKIEFDDKYPTRTKSLNKKSYKILRNLPFALRGYVFKTDYLQNYYLSQKWYKPNPNYKGTIGSIFSEEKRWLDLVEANKWKEN